MSLSGGRYPLSPGGYNFKSHCLDLFVRVATDESYNLWRPTGFGDVLHSVADSYIQSFRCSEAHPVTMAVLSRARAFSSRIDSRGRFTDPME